MKSLLVVVALAYVTPADDCPRTGGRCQLQRNARSGSLAFFEFAPASGAGMGSACACTAITGAKGETVTFTRTGDATCSRGGLATTGIANGDLVTCAGNLPRVERQSDGTLALRVESSRTNQALRSEEFNNAAWGSSSVGVAVPTITANAATSPRGDVTAERIQVPATTSGQYSYLWQGGHSTTQAVTSIYVRGNGGAGSINIISGPSPNACMSCPYVAYSWTRCDLLSVVAGGGFIFFGNDSASAPCGTGNKGAVDAFIWGAQHEIGTFVTSYIPTVAAAETRNAEAAYASLPVSVSPGSIAGSVSVPWTTTATNTRIVRVDSNGSDANRFELFWNSSPSVASFVSVASSAQQVTGAAFSPPGLFRASGWRVPGTTQAVVTVSETTAATALGALPALNRVYLGAYAPAAGFEPNGLISRICADPSPTRCR